METMVACQSFLYRLLNSFHLNGHTLGLHPQTWNHLVQHNKQCHMKVLLSNFHLKGPTLENHHRLGALL